MNKEFEELNKDVITICKSSEHVHERARKLLGNKYRVIVSNAQGCWDYEKNTRQFVPIPSYKIYDYFMHPSPHEASNKNYKDSYSMYIQISNPKGNFKNITYEDCTLFVVIPVTSTKSCLRKMKIRQMEKRNP